MDIKSKVEKMRALGMAGTLKMAAVKWKKMERGEVQTSALNYIGSFVPS